MTDPARIAGTGKTIKLKGDREVPLRYGFRALVHIETNFGGIGAVQSAVSTNLNGAIFTPLLNLLEAGLLDEHDGAGAPLKGDRLADLLIPALFQHYITTAGEALAEAFPTPAPAELPQEPTTSLVASQGSPGTTGTTSAPSPSVAATTTG